MRRALTAAIAALTLTAAGTTVTGAPGQAAPAGWGRPQPAAATPTPGSPGLGDSYFPDYGNGGYDVGHYDIRLRYEPATDRLSGTTTILATATKDLSRFNLDFLLDVESVRVNGWVAGFARAGDHELVVTPARPLTKGQQLTVVVKYAGVPSTDHRLRLHRVDPYRRRGARRQRARVGLVVVPEQRPPEGQGHLGHLGLGADRRRGDQQRRAAA